MGYPDKKPGGGFCYRDYLIWPENERWELINGQAYGLAPAPSRRHQQVSMALSNYFYNHLKHSKCEVYTAPFDVRLPRSDEQDEDIDTVVQPDIIVVCDLSKLDEKGCRGAPDLVVEIISPATAALDYKDKLALYEKHGVKEYWIAHPVDQVIMIYILQDNLFYGRPEVFSTEDKIHSVLFPDLTITVADLF